MELLFIGISTLLWVLVCTTVIYLTRYAERARMCDAFAKAFKTCPEGYLRGAEYLSNKWLEEMEKMGVDFGRKKL